MQQELTSGVNFLW